MIDHKVKSNNTSHLDRQNLPVRETELAVSGKGGETDPEKGDGAKKAARISGINGSTDGSEQLDGETHAARVAARQKLPVDRMRQELPVGGGFRLLCDG